MPERVPYAFRTTAADWRHAGERVSAVEPALIVLAAAASMAVMYWARAVFIPIVLSVLISYALEPAVRWLVRLKLPRLAASALVVSMLTGTIAYAAYVLADDAGAIVAELPEAAAKLRRALPNDPQRPGTIEQVQRAAEELQRTADAATGSSPVSRGVQRVQVVEPAIDVREYIMWGSANAVAFAGQAVLIAFFVFFLLASGDLFKRKLVGLAGRSERQRATTVQVLNDVNLQIERFLVVHVVGSLIVGGATWAAFRWIGLEQAGLWAIAAGVFNSIPYFGPVIVAAGTAIVAFLQFGTIAMAMIVAGASLAITSLEGWLIMPMLTNRLVRINEVAIFIALIFWSFVWGVWGTLLAVPMLVAVKACCDHIDALKPIGELLGK